MLSAAQHSAQCVYRHATALWRPLPTFLIVGAQKAGTTSLYDDLCRHPAIAPAAQKEIHFFDRWYHRGPWWYRTHFPLKGPPVITGESTPYYLFHPHTPRRMAETLPDVKLIVLLRHPVDRAYSQYQHQVRKGREPLSFPQAIAAEPARLRGEVARLLEDETYASPWHRYWSYLARGHYADQLTRLFTHIPRERVLVLRSEDYFADPAPVLRRIIRFLGLPDWRPQQFAKCNSASYPPMDPILREELTAYFAPYNAQLSALLHVAPLWS